MAYYYADLEAIEAAGLQHAKDCIENGQTAPSLTLFSGEWADGLTGQDVLYYSGIKAEFSDLLEFEKADICDTFEDGYLSAPWPEQVAE